MKLLRDDKGSLKDQLDYEKLPQPLHAHQSGSDSLSTLRLFFRSLEQLKAKNRQIDIEASKNRIHFIQEYGETDIRERNETIFGSQRQRDRFLNMLHTMKQQLHK